MTILAIAVAAYVAVSLLYWLGMAVAIALTWRRVPLLADLRPPEPRRWAKLSVVIPACNEEGELEEAVRTLLRQDYPDSEFILVDDRSTDATGAIMDRLAAEDPRVRAVHVTELPGGWLGKVNALDRGFRESRGDLVLFTDADIHFAPGTLRKAVAHCEERQLDHLAALPEVWPDTFALDLVMSSFLRQLVAMTRPWAAADGRSGRSIGVGAFNLVRRSAFGRTPGFAWLRMEVADDLGLGFMMKRSGARCGVVTAFGSVGLHFYRSLAQAIRSGEKGFAVARYRIGVGLVMALVGLGLEASPLLSLMPLASADLRPIGCAGIAVFIAFVLMAVLLSLWTRTGPRLGRRRAGGLAAALLGPLIAPLAVGAFLGTCIACWRRGGITWRGTLYSLDELRAGTRVPLP